MLVIVPLGEVELVPTDTPLAEAVAALRAEGAQVAIIAPDEAGSDRPQPARAGLACGEIERLGSGALKATILDPDGNSISLGNIPRPSA